MKGQEGRSETGCIREWERNEERGTGEIREKEVYRVRWVRMLRIDKVRMDGWMDKQKEYLTHIRTHRIHCCEMINIQTTK